MRERLIELILNAPKVDVVYGDIKLKTPVQTVQTIADYLLANGVIVPPCKVGDDIWWVDSESNTVRCEEQGIKAVCWDGEKWYIRDSDNSVDPIGTKWTCLTKEDAEKFLKGGEG